VTTLDPRLYATVPPAEAIAYLRDKVDIPTDGWHEFPDYYQDAAFTVAGAKGALLSQIHNAVNRAISEGQTLAEFSKRFREIAEGWVGNKPRRAQIIYQTNIRMAYAAGRYAHQLDPKVLKIQPYLQFIHSDAQVPRPHHKALDGKVFRATEIPFAVPNGFGQGNRWSRVICLELVPNLLHDSLFLFVVLLHLRIECSPLVSHILGILLDCRLIRTFLSSLV